MFKLNCNKNYGGRMDNEIIPLCNAMNSIPSIETIESCCGHGKTPIHIWFYVKDKKDGLFFLTRCIDRRYWKYGHKWKLELSVGDNFENNHLPICYLLHSGKVVGEKAYKQAESLIDNMNYHLNHEGFMSGYNLNINDFNISKVKKQHEKQEK